MAFLRRIMGAMVGGAIDRHDGKGGLKGAVIGAVASRAISRAGPVGLVALGAAAAAKMAYDHRKARKARAEANPERATGPRVGGKKAPN